MLMKPNASGRFVGTARFTPSRSGDYRINCSMNMLRPSVLRVV